MVVLYVGFAYLVFCFSIICHEWAHSLMAVIFGVKSSVFDIHYSYMPFFIGIDENINYELVSTLPCWQGILISFAGLLVNFLFVSIALLLIIGFPNSRVMRSRWSFFFLFALAFWNCNEWFNYMVIRNIFPRGDIANMIRFGFPRIILLFIGIFISIGFLYFVFIPARKHFNEKFELSIPVQGRFFRLLIIIFIIVQTVCYIEHFIF